MPLPWSNIHAIGGSNKSLSSLVERSLTLQLRFLTKNWNLEIFICN